MSETTTDTILQSIELTRSEKLMENIFRWTRILLITTVWLSAGLFGLYILAFYAAAMYQGDLERWNNILPGLYTQSSKAATSGIGLHFAMGALYWF